MKFARRLSQIASLLWVCLLVSASPAAFSQAGGVEDSYHGHLGLGTGLGMLEKWCALPNFSFDEQGGITGWTSQSCNGCHIGAFWNPSEGKSAPDCTYCHRSADPGRHDSPTVDKCLTCHVKDTAKRGDLFTAEEDVHIAIGLACQNCHVRKTADGSDHQFLKGTAMDTTEPTMKGTLSCAGSCHTDKPHKAKKGVAKQLNRHVEKVACETCHTGLRPASALARRQWNVFADGKPVTTMRQAGWLPEHKWYDNTGPGASGDFKLPILGHAERRGWPGARIYPFNPVSVDWFIESPTSAYDEVIIVPVVKGADSNQDGTVSVEEMQAVVPGATLVTAEMNFSISHSVVPKALAFDCKDCHGRNGWVLDWRQLGYEGDPRKKQAKGGGKPGG